MTDDTAHIGTTDNEILAAIGDATKRRADIAKLYARGQNPATPFDDVAAINTAIVARWSESALQFVKREALKIEGARAFAAMIRGEE